MPHQPTATLQLVAVDTYHSRLLTSMTELLGSRLHKTWRTSAQAPADAVLVDIDQERGRQYARTALDDGHGARMIVLGRHADFGACHHVTKPLRLSPLFTALSAIEAATDNAVTGRFRLLGWPVPTANAPLPSTSELRVCALLARRPLDAGDIARLLGMDPAAARNLVQSLCARGFATPHGDLLAPPPSAANRPRGLVASLRQRFGL